MEPRHARAGALRDGVPPGGRHARLTRRAWPRAVGTPVGVALSGGLRERTATKPKSARFDRRGDGTRVVVSFAAKGRAGSVATVQHERLPDGAEAERMKAFWRERVAVLKDALEG